MNLRFGWSKMRGWVWVAGFLCGAALAREVAPADGGGLPVSALPRIVDIQRRGNELQIRATVPPGVVRLLLEGCQRNDWRGWVPRAVLRVGPDLETVDFVISATEAQEMFRVRADAEDPLPASFYAGPTNFPGEFVADGAVNADALVRVGAGAPPAAEDASPTRDVVESDIWVIQGDTLYFFNQYRGLQVIDVSQPDEPRLTGTFPLPGAGEQMYLHQERFAVLLAHDPCNQWGVEAESAVLVIDVSDPDPREVARLPLRGRVVESRMVGDVLYVAAESWQPSADREGAWEAGTWVASFDLADPGAPVAREPLWYPGSGNVVTATDRFLFVAVTDYSAAWPWRSNLHIVDIGEVDGTLRRYASLPLAGRVADKFKIDLLDDVLRVVVEATETASSGRWVTVLETYRLADPRALPIVPVAALDRLELARGERLFATRFDGVRAYVVTFLRVDPLWVIDLSDPADLRIAGELEIPGWSTYIRPMGDRLLTLGVDDARGWRVAVQLFDVGDPSRPQLVAKVPLGEDSSWSEANQDEKAFGVFPEEGLLLVPVSEWTDSGGLHGVQIVDFGRDSLAKRGLLESDAVVPRRAAWHRNRVLTVSGRQMVAADITDRDRPRVSATVELAYPVDRVLMAGSYRLEFSGGSLRVEPLSGEVTQEREVDLGDLPVWGASVSGDRLYLMQGRAADVAWVYEPGAGEWVGHTNRGALLATVWDASRLPELTRLGEAKAETGVTWMRELSPHWLRQDLLVWSTGAVGAYPWRWLVDVPMDGGVVGRVAAPIGDFWIPWGYDGPRELIAETVSAEGRPQIVSQTRLEGEGSPVGNAVDSGLLLFSSRQVFESEVIETNLVAERVWIPGEELLVTNVVTGADGLSRTNITVVEKGTGEWRSVTNAYPVLRWWSRYALDVVDFGAGAEAPVRRSALEIPGRLQGLSHEGAILYTTAQRTTKGTEGEVGWLEASAYDGVSVHLVDSLEVANYGAGESYALTMSDRTAYVARGGWGADARQRVETWEVGEDGRWRLLATIGHAGVPGELRVFRDLLVARSGGSMELFEIGASGHLAPLPVAPVPGCFGGDLTRADGDRARGLWVPMGDYGAVRVGP